MSRRDSCYDNAPMEIFFATLNAELPVTESASHAARTAVFDYIERFYNHQRRHSALGYASQAVFEQHWDTRPMAA